MNMPFLTMQALLGTDKRPPELPADDSEPGRLTQAIAATRDSSENAEALRLLRAAGVQAVCGLAGYLPPRADSALPEPCPPEPRASVDKAAVIDVLRQVLSSGSDRMRLEAFRLMLGAGKVLPPALLPQALELGRRTPSLRGPIALIAGERGRWLGGRNAAWNLFATNAENELAPEVWDNGTLMQREAYLKSLRAQDPAKARERFETASASFDARERAAFTGCLGEGLSAADEAFLETLLEKDRSKEVRQAAASLLVRLPESGYVRRMGERLAACIVVPEARGGLIGRAAPGRRAPGILRSRVEKGLAGRKKAAVRGIRPARLVALSDRALRTAGVVGGAYRPVARSPHRLGAENRLAKRVAPQLAGGRPP